MAEYISPRAKAQMESGKGGVPTSGKAIVLEATKSGTFMAPSATVTSGVGNGTKITAPPKVTISAPAPKLSVEEAANKLTMTPMGAQAQNVYETELKPALKAAGQGTYVTSAGTYIVDKGGAVVKTSPIVQVAPSPAVKIPEPIATELGKPAVEAMRTPLLASAGQLGKQVEASGKIISGDIELAQTKEGLTLTTQVREPTIAKVATAPFPSQRMPSMAPDITTKTVTTKGLTAAFPAGYETKTVATTAKGTGVGAAEGFEAPYGGMPINPFTGKVIVSPEQPSVTEVGPIEKISLDTSKISPDYLKSTVSLSGIEIDLSKLGEPPSLVSGLAPGVATPTTTTYGISMETGISPTAGKTMLSHISGPSMPVVKPEVGQVVGPQGPLPVFTGGIASKGIKFEQAAFRTFDDVVGDMQKYSVGSSNYNKFLGELKGMAQRQGPGTYVTNLGLVNVSDNKNVSFVSGDYNVPTTIKIPNDIAFGLDIDKTVLLLSKTAASLESEIKTGFPSARTEILTLTKSGDDYSLVPTLAGGGEFPKIGTAASSYKNLSPDVISSINKMDIPPGFVAVDYKFVKGTAPGSTSIEAVLRPEKYTDFGKDLTKATALLRDLGYKEGEFQFYKDPVSGNFDLVSGKLPSQKFVDAELGKYKVVNLGNIPSGFESVPGTKAEGQIFSEKAVSQYLIDKDLASVQTTGPSGRVGAFLGLSDTVVNVKPNVQLIKNEAGQSLLVLKNVDYPVNRITSDLSDIQLGINDQLKIGKAVSEDVAILGEKIKSGSLGEKFLGNVAPYASAGGIARSAGVLISELSPIDISREGVSLKLPTPGRIPSELARVKEEETLNIFTKLEERAAPGFAIMGGSRVPLSQPPSWLQQNVVSPLRFAAESPPVQISAMLFGSEVIGAGSRIVAASKEGAILVEEGEQAPGGLGILSSLGGKAVTAGFKLTSTPIGAGTLLGVTESGIIAGGIYRGEPFEQIFAKGVGPAITYPIIREGMRIGAESPEATRLTSFIEEKRGITSMTPIIGREQFPERFIQTPKEVVQVPSGREYLAQPGAGGPNIVGAYDESLSKITLKSIGEPTKQYLTQGEAASVGIKPLTKFTIETKVPLGEFSYATPEGTRYGVAGGIFGVNVTPAGEVLPAGFLETKDLGYKVSPSLVKFWQAISGTAPAELSMPWETVLREGMKFKISNVGFEKLPPEGSKVLIQQKVTPQGVPVERIETGLEQYGGANIRYSEKGPVIFTDKIPTTKDLNAAVFKGDRTITVSKDYLDAFKEGRITIDELQGVPTAGSKAGEIENMYFDPKTKDFVLSVKQTIKPQFADLEDAIKQDLSKVATIRGDQYTVLSGQFKDSQGFVYTFGEKIPPEIREMIGIQKLNPEVLKGTTIIRSEDLSQTFIKPSSGDLKVFDYSDKAWQKLVVEDPRYMLQYQTGSIFEGSSAVRESVVKNYLKVVPEDSFVAEKGVVRYIEKGEVGSLQQLSKGLGSDLFGGMGGGMAGGEELTGPGSPGYSRAFGEYMLKDFGVGAGVPKTGVVVSKGPFDTTLLDIVSKTKSFGGAFGGGAGPIGVTQQISGVPGTVPAPASIGATRVLPGIQGLPFVSYAPSALVSAPGLPIETVNAASMLGSSIVDISSMGVSTNVLSSGLMPSIKVAQAARPNIFMGTRGEVAPVIGLSTEVSQKIIPILTGGTKIGTEVVPIVQPIISPVVTPAVGVGISTAVSTEVTPLMAPQIGLFTEVAPSYGPPVSSVSTLFAPGFGYGKEEKPEKKKKVSELEEVPEPRYRRGKQLLVPDLFSTAVSQAVFGKATAPAFTISEEKAIRRAGPMRVPTLEYPKLEIRSKDLLKGLIG